MPELACNAYAEKRSMCYFLEAFFIGPRGGTVVITTCSFCLFAAVVVPSQEPGIPS